ncbi:hypothetical protein BDW02DRAFT_590747 [Decorospora gaudefroyi]|uniref:Uncharacterized protein n=1 Tax=Decorospora gaudefroyi TaxID=184978 RepID=A0A6A5K4W4_9PLEO|nr:hypothetical protein BDW02DRAFT_590747 [Decorospora gaudefroyi]
MSTSTSAIFLHLDKTAPEPKKDKTARRFKKHKTQDANVAALCERARQEHAPRPVTTAELKIGMNHGQLQDFQYTLRLWNTFSEVVLENPSVGEPFQSEPPSVYQLDLYLEWLAESRTGIIEDVITETTLLNRLSALKSAIRKLLRDEKITTAGYEKPVASIAVARDLVHFLWSCDEYQYTHPHAMLQLAFLVQIYANLGTRPGEAIESDAWIQSNEGLQYQDFALKRRTCGEYEGQYQLVIQLRNRKGNRRQLKEAYVS